MPAIESEEIPETYLSRPRTLQFWGSAMVILPVFLQAPWVHIYPISACLFTLVILIGGVLLCKFANPKWVSAGSLLIGVSGSWLGGCLFWGWLRAHPVWHIPVEVIALPIAFFGLTTTWRIGAGFYLSCLLGTALTDLMMLVTGVMNKWPLIVQSSFTEASTLLNQVALELINLRSISLLLFAGILIIYLSYLMKYRASLNTSFRQTWLISSAALTTTLWVDGLFLLTALIQPRLSGLI